MTPRNSAVDQFEQSNLTWSQRLLWLGQQLHPDAPLYNMALAFELLGDLDRTHFGYAFQSVVDRCDALRTYFTTIDGVPQQNVRPPFPWTMEYLDLSGEPDPESVARVWVAQRAARPFDLRKCLFDTALIRLAPGRHVWYLNNHHLITDAWSTGLVYRAVAQAYALSLEHSLGNAPAMRPYSEYVDFARAFRDTPPYSQAKDYWRHKSEAEVEPVRLYGGRGQRRTTQTERVTVELGPDRSRALREIAARPEVRALTEHVSLFNVFATLLFAFLHRVSGQRQLGIGTPSHNRMTAALKETVGVFIEMFPLTVNLADNETFASLLTSVRAESSAFLRYALPGTSTPTVNRAGNVVLNYINASFPSFNDLQMRCEWVHAGHGDPAHDLRLQVHDLAESGAFVVHFDMSVDRFGVLEREAAAGHFEKLIDAFISDQNQSIDRPDITSDAEKHVLVDDFNRPSLGYQCGKTVVHQFEARVGAHPNSVAMECEGKSWSYGELNSLANRLGHRLEALGVRGQSVGLCATRSPDVVIGMLAVLKAGAAYVPLDPNHPSARLTYIIEDTNASVILSPRAHADSFPVVNDRVVVLDDWCDGDVAQGVGDSEDPSERPAPSDLAYILYTSGTTGQPKGVMIEHRALAEYSYWAAHQYLGGEPLAFPFFTPLTFDLTVTSIFAPLLGGGRVVVYPEEEGGVDTALLRVVDDNEVDVVKLTPAHLSLLRGRELTGSRIRTLILGGEDLKTDLARMTHQSFGGDITIYNEYGPTEATVGCVLHRFDPAASTGDSVPIGRPAARARIYVLDSHRRLVPLGVVGEIAVGGPGVARGYVARTNETAERFVPDPFQPSERMYLTGDRGRWTSDGTLEYLGRVDRQVKVHGVRVELGEIEAALLAHPKVDACAVDIPIAEAPGVDRHAVMHCARCGLPSNYPDASFDQDLICNLCHAFEGYEPKARQYFRSMEQLTDIFESSRSKRSSPYDCLMLLSGGKDSTYALYRLVEIGLNVLAVTLDNGYISDGAKKNIRRVTDELGVTHEFMTTPAMNTIFVDSLKRYSNVCNGCFKTMYTLALNMAVERKIPFIVTGLSRGQFFETRLTKELFAGDGLSVAQIDGVVLEARKAYHRVDDTVNRLLDTDRFKNDSVFDQVQFIDFYRYCDVELAEMLAFLEQRAPWIRPEDTGRSTNCLINDVGIYLHKRERGYHNYALPYSWDVRMGHKQRDSALRELDDEIDEGRVRKILSEIGYEDTEQPRELQRNRLTAYFVGSLDVEGNELRSFLTERVPAYMVPTHFVRLDELPLTENGKVDVDALPRAEERRPDLTDGFAPPANAAEIEIAKIWAHALRLDRVGIHDNFFDLGGDSITAIQIAARATAAGFALDPNLVFRKQTVAELALSVRTPTASSAETRPLAGPVALAPIQHWFFEKHPEAPMHWNQFWHVEFIRKVRPNRLRQALNVLVDHHDALRLRYTRNSDGWHQAYAAAPAPIGLQCVRLSGNADQDARQIEDSSARLQGSLDIVHGPLVAAVFFDGSGHRADSLLLVVHHLAVDGLSWPVLLEDLENAYRDIEEGTAVQLPRRTTSYRKWVERLEARAETLTSSGDWEGWRVGSHVSCALRFDFDPPDRVTRAMARVVQTTLSVEDTQKLFGRERVRRRVREDDMLLAALATVLGPLVEGERLLLDVEAHGREALDRDVDVSRTVGWFTAIHPRVLSLATDPHRALRQVVTQRENLPGPPSDFSTLRYLSSDRSVRAALSTSAPVLFNYLGRLDPFTRPDALCRSVGPLGLSTDPECTLPYRLDINAFVEKGRLQISWGFSTELFRPSTIENLAERYGATLSSMAESSLERGEFASRPEDFPLADLDKAQLSKVGELLRKVDAEK